MPFDADVRSDVHIVEGISDLFLLLQVQYTLGGRLGILHAPQDPLTAGLWT